MTIRDVPLEKGFVVVDDEVVCEYCKGCCGQCNNSIYLNWINDRLPPDHWYVRMIEDKENEEMSKKEADDLLKSPGAIIEPFEPKRKGLLDRIRSIFNKGEGDESDDH